MRIHSLTVSAFGPFAGTHVVDFEELNDAGVFLVTGPTGAGKTSILDAVCFALFGQVPGDRGVKTLRSDHAGPDASPLVVLDFSLGGRRFEVRRSPEWQRAKRSGSGTTREKASASLLERTDGVERLLSSRAQEVGHFLSDLLGMTASQFQQVAMLPQGEFQTFLKATSQERHDVLQQLFRTERFTRIEDWVNDHSRRLRDRAAGGEAAVRRLVDNMADRVGIDTPAALSADALAHSAAADEVRPWADVLVHDATVALARADDRHRQTTDALHHAQGEHHLATRLQELRSRRDQAMHALSVLEVDDAYEASKALLAADARASRCLPVLRLLDGSIAAQAAALESHALAAADAPDIDDARAAAQQVTAQLARVEALLPRESELHQTREALRTRVDTLEALAPRISGAEQAVAALPARRRALAESLAAAQEQLGSRTALEAELEQAQVRAEAAQAVPAAKAQLQGAQDRSREARDAYADARERMLDIIHRRLAGMAAELAIKLTDGEPCQVCGSTDHPAPATFTSGAVDEAAQLAATSEADALRVVHEATVQRVQEAELKLVALRQAAGGLTPEQASAALLACRAAIDEVARAEEQVEAAAQQLAALDTEAEGLAEQLRDLKGESSLLSAKIDGLAEAAGRLEAGIAAELGERSSLTEVITELTRTARTLEMLAETGATLARAEADTARHEEAFSLAAAEQGFSRLQDVRDAILDPATRTTYEQAVRSHDELLREAQAVLADPAVQALPEHAPDVSVTHQVLVAAADDDARAAREHHVRQEVADALRSLRERLEIALGSWAPARDEYLTAESMAKLVRGMGGDNELQLRLSSYVLATRLDQVIAAANERLTHMREQRYLLERTGEASRRGSQAGLGLRVIDEWTGESRDPATLSGGETFVVSLALALGLSDVVSTESGGVQLGTLFIDEGFGMLDLDTLDDVMDRLDGLRAGGRTVGVVSHVTELRNRIPTQLHVDKQRHGSSVSVTTLIA